MCRWSFKRLEKKKHYWKKEKESVGEMNLLEHKNKTGLVWFGFVS